ncbi:hypothetical protein M440DRAFT_150608 [Trichoderma longibrachiatum ATCC 18648]|uniref:Uncharacterized protein n=1 Tax=Trichoderma longibrachiatum ATCC 18648 TaxID=983965 RepID=A0A2T4BTU7_TRILO|nr:hypothetical protein M440DRAFT_150608 [Trichoderma longibrachiatum ATCC 18648]
MAWLVPVYPTCSLPPSLPSYWSVMPVQPSIPLLDRQASLNVVLGRFPSFSLSPNLPQSSRPPPRFSDTLLSRQRPPSPFRHSRTSRPSSCSLLPPPPPPPLPSLSSRARSKKETASRKIKVRRNVRLHVLPVHASSHARLAQAFHPRFRPPGGCVAPQRTTSRRYEKEKK